jgi:hypothetical protein
VFDQLQNQIAALTATDQQTRMPQLKVHQPREFKGGWKDIHKFFARSELNFAASHAVFLINDCKLFFLPLISPELPSSGIKYLKGTPFLINMQCFAMNFWLLSMIETYTHVQLLHYANWYKLGQM